MFATIRRHQKWLWGGIIAVIIPSFVIFFTPDATLSGLKGQDYGSIHGRLIPQNEYADAYYETELYYLFTYGTWPSQDESKRFNFDVDQQARTRVLLINKLKENKIHVSDDATAQYIARSFQDRRQGGFNMESYENFVRKVLPEHKLRERDLQRFAAHQVGIQHLITTYGLNGLLMTSREGESLFRRDYEQQDSAAVLFSFSNYLASVTVTTNALTQYYSNRLGMYRNPDRVAVSYVKFDVTNYFAEADQEMAKETNLNLRLSEYYKAQGANFFVDTNGAVMSEEAAKAQIKDRIRRGSAMQAALKKASAFAVDLYKMTPHRATNLNVLAATNQYKVEVTEPFSNYEGPKELMVMENFTRIAFALTDDEPFAPPVNGEDGVYVVALNKTFPSEIPSLESIQTKVTEDFRRSQSLITARRIGEEFYEKLTNGLAAGKTFDAICTEAKVEVIPVPKFSASTRDLPKLDSRLDLTQLKDITSTLLPGKCGPLTSTRDGGFVLYLRGRQPVDDTEFKKDFPDYLKGVRQNRLAQAFNEWLQREATLAQLSGPKVVKTKTATK